MRRPPVRVLHVITGLATGGAETTLLKLAQACEREAIDNRVVSLTDKGEIGPQLEAAGIPVAALGMPRGVPHPLGLFRLQREIRRARPDVVQTWLYHADLLGLIAARLAGVGAVAWNLRCSFMGEEYYRGASGLVVKALAVLSSWPAVVVVNSHAGRRFHEHLGYHPRRWQVIGNGFDLELFRPDARDRARLRREIGVDDDTTLIGLVARWDAVKGHNVFLEAAAKSASVSSGKLHFVLVGEGCTADNRALGALVAPALGQRLSLLGERRDVPAINAALDIACCTSIGEGFPNVIGEAMASGVPCVVSDVGDCAKVVGQTGWVVPPADSAALARAWAEAAALAAAAKAALGAAARRRIEADYGLERSVQGYQSLYRDLAGATGTVR